MQNAGYEMFIIIIIIIIIIEKKKVEQILEMHVVGWIFFHFYIFDEMHIGAWCGTIFVKAYWYVDACYEMEIFLRM